MLGWRDFHLRLIREAGHLRERTSEGIFCAFDRDIFLEILQLQPMFSNKFIIDIYESLSQWLPKFVNHD